MPSELFKHHIHRLQTVANASSNTDIATFIKKNTYLKGEPFTFAGHEYQEDILNEEAPNLVIIKSAQIGISEMSARLAISRCALINGFSAIYTLPSATRAQEFMKTRIDPVVQASPYLKSLVSSDVDNASVKRFGDSYLWLKGCQVDRQAISTPADLLIFDETDNSDLDVMTLFESRIIHSEYKMTVKLSTPTVPGYGISLAFEESRRNFHFCQCNHCGHWFSPSYYDHVRVPNFKGDLQNLSKQDFADKDFLWRQAYTECPSCGDAVDMVAAKREWVMENTSDNYFDVGYKVSPFSCPKMITAADLVKASVTFNRRQDFVNQRLGEAMADSESSLTEEDFVRAIIPKAELAADWSYVMGLDMGTLCWATVMAVSPQGQLIVTHIESIRVHQVVERVVELSKQWKVRVLVVDRGPLIETVYRIQSRMANAFAAVFVSRISTELFKVVDKEETEGAEGMRQVSINKDSGLDMIMAAIRTGEIKKLSCELDGVWAAQLMDNKRVQTFKLGEMVYAWQKTKGDDHLHMALLYAYIASRMMVLGTSGSVGLELLSTFSMRRTRVLGGGAFGSGGGSGIFGGIGGGRWGSM